MATVTHRPRLPRRGLRGRGTPGSQVTCSAAAVTPSSSSDSPALEWPRKETRQKAEEWNDLRLEALAPGLPEVARALIKCDGGRHRCSLPICAVCALAYRQGPIAQLHALAHTYPGPHEVATIYLSLIPPGGLAAVDVPHAREMFRKRLDRAGFQGAIAVGGIEAGWQHNLQRWLLHAHVLAIGVDPQAWERLETALKKGGTSKPLKRDPLCDPGEQLSYCIKFMPLHRPGRRRVPLPSDRLVELAAWWSRHRFEDFLFAYGARRRGGRIVVDE